MALQVVDANGNKQVLPTAGVDPTYRSSVEILAAAMPTTAGTDLVTIQLPASNTQMARLKRIHVLKRATGATTNTIPMILQVVRRATADTGTPASVLTPTRLDPADPAATAVVNTWNTTSVSTTNGAALVLDEIQLFSYQAAGVPLLGFEKDIVFTNAGDKAPVLRGATQLTTAETYAITLATTYTTAAGEALYIMIEHEEAPLAIVTPASAG